MRTQLAQLGAAKLLAIVALVLAYAGLPVSAGACLALCGVILARVVVRSIRTMR